MRVAGSSTAAMASPEEGAVVLVGSGQPVKAFQIALKTMKQGEKASLKIKPECKPLPLLMLLSECPLPTLQAVSALVNYTAPYLYPPYSGPMATPLY